MSILEQASAIVDADRERTYGRPAKNLLAIAELWTGWLHARGWMPQEQRLGAEDVACMMTLLKLARLANNPTHADSQVDACGYMYLLSRVQQGGDARGVE